MGAEAGRSAAPPGDDDAAELTPEEREALRGAGLDLFSATDGACQRLPGRCGYTSCRHHLEAEQTKPRAGARARPAVVPEPCVLKVIRAAGAGIELETIGGYLGCTRERVRQIEITGSVRFRLAAREDGHGVLDFVDRPEPGRRRRDRLLALRSRAA